MLMKMNAQNAEREESDAGPLLHVPRPSYDESDAGPLKNISKLQSRAKAIPDCRLISCDLTTLSLTSQGQDNDNLLYTFKLLNLPNARNAEHQPREFNKKVVLGRPRAK